MSEAEAVHINSFIVLDLETTGLPQLQKKTKITELSGLFLTREHIIYSYKAKQFLPRVVNKLNVCIYPRKMVNTGAAEVSGLTNELLEDCQDFNSSHFSIFEKMINLMKPPVCILAHNGIKFDFPIFRSEIEHIGKALSDDIYCADTLPAFRELVYKNNIKADEFDNFDYGDIPSEPLLEIEGENNVTDNVITREDSTSPTTNKISENCDNSCNDIWGADDWNSALHEATEKAEQEEFYAKFLEKTKKINETTPKSKRNGLNSVFKMPTSSTSKKKNVSKQLFNDKNSGDSKPRLSYRLQDCYSHLTGKTIVNAHRADSDTHALLECVVALGPPVLDWFDSHCQPFNTIKKLW